MSPSTLAASSPTAPHLLNGAGSTSGSSSSSTAKPAQEPLDPKLFPDGLRTSGQHPPIESQLYPYSEFPKQISGPTLWTASDYKDHPERWTHPFTGAEIAELSKAADDFLASGMPLTGMSRDRFPLPTLSAVFAKYREIMYNGRGFILFKNLPVIEWGNLKSAAAYMGFGAYFGYFVSQNGRGHVLGHVKDLGEDPTKSDRVRIYRTNARQFFHTDACDLVGLLCIARSFEGGESDIASTQEIFNVLQQEHPEAVEEFVKPQWWFDRKGEVSDGQGEYYRSAVYFMENDPNPATRRVFARFDPMNVRSLARFNSGPDAKIPPLSDAQLHALDCLEDTAKRLSLHMILQPGDIQLIANTHIFHARTAYTDWPVGSVDDKGVPRPKRQLMRLWLATPKTEGGWRTPFPDAKEKKRGGIQVNNNPPTCPIDAE